MDDTLQEKYFENSPIPVSIENSKNIIKQMEKCICRINKNNIKGTGFFCKIPYQSSLLPVLITNNHILNKSDIEIGKEILISINKNNFKNIKIDNSRIIYSNELLDITIIEIKPDIDYIQIDQFLELDEKINLSDFDFNKIYKSIYILHYPSNSDILVSYGLLKDINKKEITHLCYTDNGSSGSPILSLESLKVIGIHKGGSKQFNFNKGIFIQYVLKEFNNFEKSKKNDNKDYYTLEKFEELIKYSKNKKNIITKNPKILTEKFGLIQLMKLSIFDNEERGTIKKDKQILNTILNIIMDSKYSNIDKKNMLDNYKINDKEKRGIGCMLGMIIGNAMGQSYEFQPVRYDEIDIYDMGKERGFFSVSPGQWIDSMGLCLADSLIVNNGKLDQFDFMHRIIAYWKGRYNSPFKYNEDNNLETKLSIDIGNVELAIRSYLKSPKAQTDVGSVYSSGNGSLKRNASIPICFHYDINLACENAKLQSLLTSQGIESKECCRLITYIIVKIFEGKKLKNILENLGKKFKTDVKSVEYLAKSKKEDNDINRDWNWKSKQYFYSSYRAKNNPCYIGTYVMDAMAMSLHIIYNTNSFKESIVKAINLKGDCASIGSIVGQIAGAYYPIEEIPTDWIKAIYKWDHGEIALRGYILSRLKSKESIYNNT